LNQHWPLLDTEHTTHDILAPGSRVVLNQHWPLLDTEHTTHDILAPESTVILNQYWPLLDTEHTTHDILTPGSRWSWTNNNNNNLVCRRVTHLVRLTVLVKMRWMTAEKLTSLATLPPRRSMLSKMPSLLLLLLVQAAKSTVPLAAREMSLLTAVLTCP